MSGSQSISTRRAYGVQRVCRVWHRARSSVYARRQATRSPALCRRRGPIGAAPAAQRYCSVSSSKVRNASNGR